MEYQIESVQGATVVKLKGAFDRSTRDSLETELLALVSLDSELVFDLAEVDFISSAGLHLLLDIYRRCEQQNAHLALTNLSEPVSEILAITGIVSSNLPIYKTLEDGLAALHTKRK